MEASLVMFKADGERREFPLTKSETVVGRKNTCDLRIPLSSVSRQHFKVLMEDETLKLRDLGSSNGTYHNDERVLEAELNPGDQIRVGPVTFIVTIDGEPSEVDIVKTVLPQDTGEIEAPAAAAESAGPEALDTGDAMPGPVEEEAHTPTVDVDEEDDDDEDPIAALEALALNDDDDDDESDVIIPMIDDDEEEESTKT